MSDSKSDSESDSESDSPTVREQIIQEIDKYLYVSVTEIIYAFVTTFECKTCKKTFEWGHVSLHV